MKKNIIYIILIAALVITTLFNVYERMTVESEAKSAEITLSYKDIFDMSEQSDHDIVWWFKAFKTMNIQSVSLVEETLQSLVDEGNELELEVLINLKKDTLWETRYPKSFVDYVQNNEMDNNDVVVVSSDQALKSFIVDGLEERYPESFFTLFEDGDHYAILLDGIHSELRYNQVYKSMDSTGKPVFEHQDVIGSAIYYYGIGFDSEKIDNIKASGLEVNLRPWNNMRFPDGLIEAFDNELKEHDLVQRMFIFSGKEVLGYPNSESSLFQYMEDNKIVPVLIETGVQRSNTEQKGLMQLTENLNYNAVRLLPLVDYLQERFKHYNYEGGEEIENVMFRAITERNIRLIYFRPFKLDAESFVTDVEEYRISFERLENRLKEHDIALGKFSVMPLKTDSLWSGIIIGFGIVAIIILTARYFFKIPKMIEYILLILGGLLITAALIVSPNLGRQLLALAAAVTISSFGAVVLIGFSKELIINKKVFKFHEIVWRSIVFTIAMGLLALLGGLVVGGLLSHSKYLLEIEFFRGVKASEIIPLVVFVVLYLLKFGYDRSISEIKEHDVMLKDLFRFLNVEIKISYLLTALVGGVILYIYIARSGHETTVQPSDIEMIFRNFLELKLLARPRLKEFLMAVPALMMFSYISYKVYKPLVALLGIPAVITFTSIINTFSHLRAPIYLSVVRTFLAIGFGIVIGLIGMLVFEGGERLYKRIKRKYLAYESEEKELGA